MELQNMFVQYLFNDETKAKIVAALNESVDIPFINEKTEGKIIDAVYDVVEDVMKSQLLK
jgi:hypothetical protein